MNDTKTKILDLAERLTQVNGFNGFSYLDLAEEIGIKAASIHYYFKSKDDLAVALVERTYERHTKSFQDMDRNIDTPKKRLEAVIEYFQSYAQEEKFCLCGMMAVNLHSVSPRVSKRLDHYFADFQAWLAQQFKQIGHKNPKVQGMRFLSALEGSLLLARLRRDPKMIYDTLIGFLKS